MKVCSSSGRGKLREILDRGAEISSEVAREAGDSCKGLLGHRLIWIGVKV